MRALLTLLAVTPRVDHPGKTTNLSSAALPLKTNPRWLEKIFLLLALVLCLTRFAYLRADFPNHSPWRIDQAKFTDEGWWSNGAVRHFLTGHWHLAGDYNPAIAVPVWPLLLTPVFHFTGVSIVAARALNVAFSMATVGLVYLLLQRYDAPAALAALLLAASPFAFVFSRLVTLDSVVVFEFCLMLWIASHAGEKKVWPLLTLGFLIPVMLLTKTTALALVPAILWLLATTARKIRLRSILLVIALAGAWMGIYLSIVLRSRYADDCDYFFAINSLPDVDWRLSPSFILQLLTHGMWIDRILYPVGLAVLLLSLLWLRQLWRNPLFAAAWIAIAGDAAYILRRQDDYAPRYFLAMLVPLILVLVLTLRELRTRHRALATLLAATLAAAVVMDTAQIFAFLHHPQFQFYDAAKSIQKIVDADPHAHRLLLGSSGDQLSLMTGIPSINDVYSNQDLDQKASLDQPGWYIGWNELDQDMLDLLSAFQLQKVAGFPVFDHEERDWLTLYRMVPAKPEETIKK